MFFSFFFVIVTSFLLIKPSEILVKFTFENPETNKQGSSHILGFLSNLICKVKKHQKLSKRARLLEQ